MLMLKATCLCTLLTAVLVPAMPAYGQSTRKMEFQLGALERELRIEIEYHDPGELASRLKGSRLVPVRFSATNISSQRVPFDYSRIRLTLSGTQSLAPVDPGLAIEEVKKSGYPPLLGFLASTSSAFHRNVLERERLRNGDIAPGENRDGYLFFMRPQANQPFDGVMWLEISGYPPQALETKAVSMTVRPTNSSVEALKTKVSDVLFGEVPYKKSYALLIGIGKYQHLPPLSSPLTDVRKMHDFLYAQGFDEIMSVTDEDVTPATFRHPQNYFKAKLQPDDRFLFYYSGHGVSQMERGRPRGYLPLLNERPGSHAHSIAMDDLVSWLQELSTKHLLVILDACFSGLAVSGLELKGLMPSVDRRTLISFSRGEARYLLMAGTDGQQSLADRKWNGSLFTEMIIRGAQSAREADVFNDRIIATKELYSWVRASVSKEAHSVHRELTPLLKDLGPKGRPDDVSPGEFVFLR
jgi:hypothetical protein